MKPIWGPSYERGLELAKLGIELPYLQQFPGKKRLDQRALYVSEIRGYAQSLIIDYDLYAEYVIPLQIGTDRTRETVRSFRFTPPWPEQSVSWDFDPAEELPKSVGENVLTPYKDLFDARLPAIFNERSDLHGGHPVKGLLFGRSLRPIPPSASREAPATAELFVLSTSGARVHTTIHLSIYISQQRLDRMRTGNLSNDSKTARDAERSREHDAPRADDQRDSLRDRAKSSEAR